MKTGAIVCAGLAALLTVISFFETIKFLGALFRFAPLYGIGLFLMLGGSITALVGTVQRNKEAGGSSAQNGDVSREIVTSGEPISFWEYAVQPFKKYAQFSGRARRKEYWGFFLLTELIQLPFMIWLFSLMGSGDVDSGMTAYVFLVIIYLVILMPSLAVFTRRMHDTDRSGWTWLVALIPFVGAIMLLVYLCTDGTPGSNKYGPNPKEAGGDGGFASGSGASRQASAKADSSLTDIKALEKLGKMYKDGLLTQEEFEAKKKQILKL